MPEIRHYSTFTDNKHKILSIKNYEETTMLRLSGIKKDYPVAGGFVNALKAGFASNRASATAR